MAGWYVLMLSLLFLFLMTFDLCFALLCWRMESWDSVQKVFLGVRSSGPALLDCTFFA